MKNKTKTIAIALSAGLLTSPAFASEISGSRITSVPGMPQSQWIESDVYKSFTCPEGSGRSEGVDMNYTTTRADDTFFVYCSTREIIVSTVISETPISTVTPVSDNVVSPNPVPSLITTETTTSTTQTGLSVIDTQTATIQDTSTAATISSSSVDVTTSWVIEIRKLIEQLLALIARINR